MDQSELDTIGVEAYTYLYPLVLMELTRAQLTNVEAVGDAPLHAPMGAFVHVPAFPPGDFKGVVRPNFDTLYSAAFVDLSDGPVVLSVPEGDHHYLLPMYDMFGEVFASPGTRTTGTDAQTHLLVGPDGVDSVPEGMRRIDSPHDVMWIIGRTEASPATYDSVHRFQAGLQLTPLSVWPDPPAPVVGAVDPTVDGVTPPLDQAFALDAGAFYAMAMDLLARYPSHFCDQSIMMRLERVGLVEGEPFDITSVPADVQAALVASVDAAQERIRSRQAAVGTAANGWRITAENMGSYGQDYLQRACVELIGLGANLPEDAIYPLTFVDADGDPLDGSRRYVLRFAAGQAPPARAFWSLTLYDDDGFQVPNELDRFAIGDRDDLVTGPDGAIELAIQHEAPGGDGDRNWLPAPAGSFNLCLRLYYPETRVLDGLWVPPAVQKVR